MPPKRRAKVLEKERLFVAAFVQDFNATNAAIAAGYPPPGARVAGHHLLTKLTVQTAIAERIERRVQKLDLSAEKIVLELCKLGFANMADYVRVDASGDTHIDLSNINRDQFAAIGEITTDVYMEGRGDDVREVKRTKFKLLDKKGALIDLLRHVTGQKLGDNIVNNNLTVINNTMNQLNVATDSTEAVRSYQKLLTDGR